MCQAALDSVRQYMGSDDKKDDNDKIVPMTASDVPLGDGLAGQAKLSIMSRRARLEAALEEAETGRKQ